LLGELTAWQISEWEAYDKLDPIGTWREDFRFACLSSMITNLAISIHGEKGTKMTAPIDFMQDWTGDRKDEVRQQSPEEMKAIFQQIVAANKGNKKVVKK
jgi:hypothetical protein